MSVFPFHQNGRIFGRNALSRHDMGFDQTQEGIWQGAKYDHGREARASPSPTIASERRRCLADLRSRGRRASPAPSQPPRTAAAPLQASASRPCRACRWLAAERAMLEDRLRRLGSTMTDSDVNRERRPYPKVRPKYRNLKDRSEAWAGAASSRAG